MTISLNKQVTLNGITFSCGQFIENPDKYIEMVAPLFRPTSFSAKHDETEEHRLTRLFYQLYYKKGYAADCDLSESHHSRRTQRAIESISDEFAILDKLGINVVKHSAKSSRIVFKNSGNNYKIKNDNLDSLIQALKENKQFNYDELPVKFGVELEFVAEDNLAALTEFNEKMRKLVGNTRYDIDLRYRHNRGTRWELGRDGSVRDPDKYGFELTSPIYTYGNPNHLAELEAVIELVKTVLHGEVNKTCGTHVHMSFKCDKSIDRNMLKVHFAKCYSNSENSLFDKLVPKYRNRGQYCRPTTVDTINDRYRKLNLTTIDNNSDLIHIEFRQLNGTLNFNKIMSWINVQRLFINVTMHNATKAGTVETLNLNEVICDKNYCDDVETLMSMSMLAA